MRRIKKRDYEDLSDQNIARVISLLHPANGTEKKSITKKEACSLLKIAYNTTRLGRIIDEYNERKAYVERQKAKKRGKKASPAEISQVIEQYLSGENYANIAKGLFRSSAFVKAIIERIGVPQRPANKEAKEDILPDSCVAESFEPGDIVYSSKYHAAAKIIKEVGEDEKHLGKIYQIYVMESIDASDSFFPHIMHGGFNAFQPAYELGSLQHLKEYGINLNEL